MAARERVSSTSKLLILSCAVLVDVFLLIFGIVAVIPVFGIFGTMGSWLISFLWMLVLTFWLISIGAGMSRLWARMSIILTLEAGSLMLSMFPFLGGLVSAGASFINTLLVYFLIRKIEKEDAEYNKLQEQKELELQKARGTRQRTLVEKRYSEEGRKLDESSVLNKKNA